MTNINARFLEGLKKYNISIQEIEDGEWKYCGGNKPGRRLNYFNMHPKLVQPEHVSECVCGHKIKEQCYLVNSEGKILVLGNCCIKRFIPPEVSGKTCNVCGAPHKNRIVNRCNKCRVGVCDKCDRPCNPKYKVCYNCKFGN